MTATFNGQDAVGNPTHPVVSPELFFPDQTSFWDRLESFAYNIYFRYTYHTYWLPRLDKTVRKYFGNDIPYLGDLERNLSLLLMNVNPLMHTPRPNVPAIIEISQMHIKSDKGNLPEDIKKYLDAAKEGFVYFSLGSNIRSASLGLAVRQVIIDALSELPYKVLWKWETDELPGQPQNVKTSKWFPQQEVLAHPNIKAFVTQGGIQSIEEALTNGVPMVGIPFFADQPKNVGRLVELDVAKHLNFKIMTKDELKESILEVARNISYKQRTKEVGSLLTDVPIKGLDKAIWWIEYVLRHKGAQHMVSPTRDMPYWKYFCLDVIGFLLFVLVLFVYVTYKIARKVALLLNSMDNPKGKVE